MRSEFYDPAHAEALRLTRGRLCRGARRRPRWNQRVREVWDRVRFVETGPAPAGTITERASRAGAGGHRPGRDCSPTEVRVEVVMGRVGTDGGLEDTEVMVLPPAGQNGSRGGLRERDRARAHRQVGLCPAHQPQPLRRSADAALHQPAQVERLGLSLAGRIAARQILQALHYQRGPTGLMTGAQTAASIGMEEFVEQCQIPPVGILGVSGVALPGGAAVRRRTKRCATGET